MAILVRQASKQEVWLAGKLLEAVYEGKSVEIGVRGRMEEHGTANRSWARAVCVRKGALAAEESGQPLACPHDVVLPQPPSPVPLSSGHACVLPSPTISSWGSD